MDRLKRWLLQSHRDFSGPMFWNLTGFVGLRLAVIFATMMTGNALGIEALALFSFFQLTTTNFATFAVLGLATPMTKYASELPIAPDAIRAVAASLQLLVLFTVFSCAALLVMSRTLGLGLEVGAEFLATLVVCVAATALYSGFNAFAIGVGRFRMMAAAMLAGAAVVVGGTLLAVAAGSSSHIILAYTAGFVTIALVMGWGLRRDLRGAQALLFFPQRDVWRRIFPQLGILALVGGINALVPYLLMRQLAASPDAVELIALFTVCLQMFGMAMILPSRLALVGFPHQVRSAASGDRNAARQFDRRYLLLAAAGTIVMLMLVLPAMPWLMAAYGSELAPHWPAAALFMLAALPAAVSSVLGNRLLANSSYRIWLALTACWGLIVAVTLAATLSSAGRFAPAIGYLTGYLVLCMIALVAVRWRRAE